MLQSVDVASAHATEDAVRQARRMLEAGRLEEAERQFGLLVDGPWASEAHKGLGDARFRRGSLGSAAESYRKALSLRPDWPEVENNLGSVYKTLGNNELAERHYRRALSLNPELSAAGNNLGVLLAERGELAEATNFFARAAEGPSPMREVRRNLATALFQLGRVEEARAEFERALASDSKDPDALIGIARLRRVAGEAQQALELAREALELRPGFGEAYLEAGEAALALGNPEQALPYCRHAVEAAPRSAQAHLALGTALLGFGAPQDAEHHYRRALAIAPNAPTVLIALGRFFEEQNRLDAAQENYQAAFEADPENALATSHLGNLALRQRKPTDALRHFESAVKLQPSVAAAHNNLAAALNELGRHQEAAKSCREAIALNPNLPEAHYNLGAIFQTLGDLDEARRCYERALELNPNLVPAIFSLSNLAPQAAGALTLALAGVAGGVLPTVEALLASEKIGADAKVQLHFARVRIHDQRGEHDAAFAAAVAGNAIEAARRRYDGQAFERLVGGIKGTFTVDFFAKRNAYGSPSEEPIFIIGMPRSGTTLVEQVLASHPQVFGAGELALLPQLAAGLRRWSRARHDFPQGAADLYEPEVLRLAGAYRRHTRELAGSSRRVTDKMTSNLFYLGLAALMFPRAKVIFCRRDPIDLFISGYFMLFRNPIPYTTDQRNFAHFYNLQEALLAHWRQVLPLQILELEYEALVADQEANTRQLLQYCGLEWDPRCLDFHLTERPIRTGSDTQVRRPLYRTSVGRAAPYRKHLQELEAALAERFRTA